jgi:putative ABC transport system substrate-binding protein
MAVFTNDQTAGQLAITQDGAKQLGLSLQVVDFKRPPFNYEAGFAAAARANTDALIVLGSGLWVSARHRITELALRARMPTMFHHSQWAAAGGLISYGYNFPVMWRRGAEMVTKILGGAKAGDIPVEQPTVYELVINMKTARTLGIKVSQSMQLRIDRVID